MTEFARVFHFNGNAGELLNQVFADQSCVQRGSTAGENDPGDVAKLGRGHVQSTKLSRTFFSVETAAHGITDRVRLLEDFLQHVVRELASVHVLRTEFHPADLVITGVASDRADLEGVP